MRNTVPARMYCNFILSSKGYGHSIVQIIFTVSQSAIYLYLGKFRMVTKPPVVRDDPNFSLDNQKTDGGGCPSKSNVYIKF